MTDKKTNIKNSTFNLFKKYGIKRITIDDIAFELGVSKKTIYQFYETKNDLVLTVFSDLEEDINKSSIDSIFKENRSPIEEIILLFNTKFKLTKEFNPVLLYDLSKYYPAIYRNLKTSISNNLYIKCKENINKGIYDGVYRKDLNPENVSRLFLHHIFGFHESAFIDRSMLTNKTFIHEIIAYHIRAIATQKGIKIFDKLRE
ncbi:MAG TPA: TetR/AcrR family transcriptional regulator [Flavobacterium sp.]|nr:TetR/AcrR family transcriptional regulator [Flavobacterium sp.]HRZ74225.1 TetR/AcrR family transcriptional regulator [Flavobacterium sp.]